MSTRLVFVHGGPGYVDYLEPFFKQAFAQSFESIFYTQNQSESVTVQNLVQQLSHQISASRTVLIGHSWGGVLCLEYLKQIPDSRIKGLVLLDSFLCVDDITVEYKKELSFHNLSQPTLEQIFLTTEELKLHPHFIKDIESTSNPKILEKLWNEYLSKVDFRSFVSSITLPVLNLYGEKDIRVPARVIQTFASFSPRIENHPIPDAAHFPFLLEKQRKEIVRAIARFCERLK
jgi:pimeloyl-ACP methyl ester carboxylesterase